MNFKQFKEDMKKRAAYGGGYTATDALAAVRLGQLKEQRERNANRVLQKQLGIEDPTTAQRRLNWRLLGKVLKSGLKGAGIGAAIGGGIGGYAGYDTELGAGPGAVAGAGTGAAWGGSIALLLSLLKGGIGSIRGDMEKTDPELVKRVFGSDGGDVSVSDIMKAKAHLNKLVQQRMSDYQAEAPTQVIV